MIFHQDPFTRLRLVKGPDERSLNYELISKTQHLKKNQLIIYNLLYSFDENCINTEIFDEININETKLCQF